MLPSPNRSWNHRFVVRRGALVPRARIVCFPHAGGTSDAYAGWRDHLDADLDLWCYEMPGHGRRLREAVLHTLAPAVEEVVGELAGAPSLPTIYVGHSLGALAAFEAVRMSRRHAGRAPLALVVTGCRAPHQHHAADKLVGLSDSDLLAALRATNGTPAEFFSSPALIQLFLPVLRADLELAARYVFRPEPLLDFGIHAFVGDRDPDVPVEAARAWSELTTGASSLTVVPGDHFFVKSYIPELTRFISNLVGNA